MFFQEKMFYLFHENYYHLLNLCFCWWRFVVLWLLFVPRCKLKGMSGLLRLLLNLRLDI